MHMIYNQMEEQKIRVIALIFIHSGIKKLSGMPVLEKVY